MRISFRKAASVVVGLVAALFLHAAPALAQAGEEISSFSADILVRQDGTVGITERIGYYFPTLRHGIYRDIPTRYETDGKTFDIPIKVISVTDGNGRPWKYQVIRNDVGIRIKIGDPDKEISGPQTYAIEYEAVGALRYFADHDELYWNVTGNAWEVPIRRVTAVVRLPEGVDPADMRLKCYTGDVGSTAQDCLTNIQGRNGHFAADGPLTVVVGWPPGIVAKLLPPEPNPWLPLMPYLLPLAAFVGLAYLWWKNGRDPEGQGTLVVQYDPPEGMRPAEVGALVDEDAGLKDVSATIVDLAVRGYLKIREIEKKGLILTSKDYEFELLKEWKDDKDLRDHEKKVLMVLFDLGGKICRISDLKENHGFYKGLPGIKKGIYEELVQQGHFPVSPEQTRAIFYGIGGVIVVAAFFVPQLIPFLSESSKIHTGIAIGVSGLITMFFAGLMAKKTAKGVAATEHALGFHEYLEKAEKYRIQWQESENVFEKFLPYAMAFGVADKWSKAFETMNIKPPTWYEGSAFSHGAFNAVAFNSMLGSMNSAMTTAMKSAPQQSSGGSGFGGGGSSGGGGGGGGGGSW